MGIGIVETKSGKVRGSERQGYTVFRGIPYARAPVGELRWRRPLPAQPWEGVRDARRFGPRCMQIDLPKGSFYNKEFYADEDYLPEKSEDGLNLNVWTPAENREARLPVAVWIHGGAFTQGFGSEMEFDGAAFARRGVVLVTLNYRLSVFGFFAHPELTREAGSSGNYGLWDQLLALAWVRENIAAFGGDPERVTIFGQSAGGMSVQALVCAAQAKGLVHGAILQSCGGYLPESPRVVMDLSQAEAVGERFARMAGAADLSALRAIPAERLLELAGAFPAVLEGDMPGVSPYRPCLDGELMTRGVIEAVDAGAHLDIPYMIGSTLHDGGRGSGAAAGMESMGYRACVGWSLANERLGRKPAYVYHFTRVPLGDDAGAFHSSELWYVFGTLGRSWRPKVWMDYELSERMSDLWCNFVKAGNPNGGSGTGWKPCSEGNRYVQELC